MIRIAKVLGKLALGPDFTPKEFYRAQALAEMKSGGETITDACDPIERLKLNGVLIEKEGGLDVRLRFALDPIAEYLAAVAYFEDCGSDQPKWDVLMDQSKPAPGFRSALKLVRQAYERESGR
jgi:hypothetical protein